MGHLGPDLLGPDWDAGRRRAPTARRPARPLGEALLDQRNLAGIGNVYKSELVLPGPVTPWLPVGELPAGIPARLVATAHRLLEANKDSFDRRTTHHGPDRRRRPGRPALCLRPRGRPCLRCGTPIRKADRATAAASAPPTGARAASIRDPHTS